VGDLRWRARWGARDFHREVAAEVFVPHAQDRTLAAARELTVHLIAARDVAASGQAMQHIVREG